MTDPGDGDQLRPGARLIGKYEIVRPIGRGGFGLVYEARHLGLGTRVAIKVLRSESRQHPSVLARFRREASASAQLQSKHVVRVTDVDALPNGTPFIVMELLKGRDLEAELAARGRIPVREAVGYVLQAASAIAEAHARGVVHRDLKPSNLFLCDDRGGRTLKVLDFGLSKIASELSLTKTNSSLGTPLYMAPEQFRSAKNVDARADIWSLAVIAYHLLALRTPFSGETRTDLMVAILGEEPVELTRAAPNVPPELARAVMKNLRKNAADRHQSVEELARALAPFGPPDAFVPVASGPWSTASIGPGSTLSDSSQDTPATADSHRAWTVVWLLAGVAALLIVGIALRTRFTGELARANAAAIAASIVPAAAPQTPPSAAPLVVPVASTPLAMPPVTPTKPARRAPARPRRRVPGSATEPNLGF